MKIAFTGKSGTGKTTISSELSGAISEIVLSIGLTYVSKKFNISV